MNCLEFRRRIAIDPRERDAEMLAHRAECTRCAEAHAEAQRFDSTLAAALAVPVPAGLAERVLLAQLTQTRGEHAPRRVPWPYALAASLVLAFGAAAWWRFATDADLPQLAVEHLSHEPYALASRAEVEPARLRTSLAAEGVVLGADPGPVQYLNRCGLAGDPAMHLVVQTADGPVTLYVVVGRRSEARAVWSREGLHGRTVPVGEHTLVLLAHADRAFDAIEQRWTQALDPSALNTSVALTAL